jgi:hypothetical protein
MQYFHSFIRHVFHLLQLRSEPGTMRDGVFKVAELRDGRRSASRSSTNNSQL